MGRNSKIWDTEDIHVEKPTEAVGDRRAARRTTLNETFTFVLDPLNVHYMFLFSLHPCHPMPERGSCG
jgi:hypothetical protein